MLRSLGSTRSEGQANKFAAALLAPRDLLREAAPKSQWQGRSTVQQLAGTFGMSLQAMLFRLYELGLAHEGDHGVTRSGKRVDPNRGSLFS
jgi:Zn-dependent peptidase ImmA (M78 family)